MTQKTRETWNSKLGFILASVGSALGLGAIWKLPYIIGQNGGGAFIILFACFNFLVGLPLFIGELILGRESKKGVVSAFTTFSSPGSSWAALGWMIIAVVLLILGWYCIVAGWAICYIFLALTDAFQGLSRDQIGESFDALRKSGGLNIVFQLTFIALNAGVLVKGISRGIEKWSRFMTSGLFLVLVGLALYNMQLSGFQQAVQYLLFPDFSKLSGPGVLQALGLALFTLSLSYGAVLTYGSYLKKGENIPKISAVVVVANLCASVLIALAIFPIIFTFGFAPESGEGLVFKTLPFVFEQLPGSMVIAVVFFTLLLFAALTSSIAMFEVVVANFCDLQIFSRNKAILVSCAIAFVLGLPIAYQGEQGESSSWQKVFGVTYLETTNLLIDWVLVVIAGLTTLFVAYYLPFETRLQGFVSGTKSSIWFKPWVFLMRTVVPIAILLVIAHRAHIIHF